MSKHSLSILRGAYRGFAYISLVGNGGTKIVFFFTYTFSLLVASFYSSY